MGLYDIVAASQGGRCFYNLGRRLQIDEMRAAAVTWHLFRALRPSIESWLARPAGGHLLLEGLGRERFDLLLGETANFTDGRIRDRGYRIVSQWIASAPLDLAELDRAVAVSGLSREALMRVLPWIAALEMGALQRAADKPLRAILARLRGKRFAEHAASPALAILDELARSGRNEMDAAVGRTIDGLIGRLIGGHGSERTARVA
jgi:hypothetical protein